MITNEMLIAFLRDIPGVQEVSVVGDGAPEIVVETVSSDAAETVRAALTIVRRDISVCGSRVFIS
jgi:hypothetical protein